MTNKLQRAKSYTHYLNLLNNLRFRLLTIIKCKFIINVNEAGLLSKHIKINISG